MESSSSASPSEQGSDGPRQAGNAYVAGVVHSASTLTWDAAKDSFFNNMHDSCARKGFLWGSLVGTLMGAHRFKQGGHPRAITRSIIFGFSVTFLSQFYMCRQQEFDTKVALREYMARQARGHVPENPEAQGPPPSVPAAAFLAAGQGSANAALTFPAAPLAAGTSSSLR